MGSQDEISIKHLAERITEQLDSPSPIELITYEEAYEVGFEDMERRRPSIAKVHDAIGWKPELGLTTSSTALPQICAAAATGELLATRGPLLRVDPR